MMVTMLVTAVTVTTCGVTVTVSSLVTANSLKIRADDDGDGSDGDVHTQSGDDPGRGLVRTGYRCDYCGSQFGTLKHWKWPGRPGGIRLHSRCKEPWFDSARTDPVLQ